MLDVYRNYYGLTGEPFRLGPDYRFSLHHESYANAKAYLEYAIYQGEGFIAITGGPGTGKTTLISEILAGLDRDKVQVATLTSTQLESRDLLYMVASSFDLHPEDASKGNLIVEIESFLVRKLRDGQRAILIVDEAQGLSTGALEELRLLANLQHQYQLLLQIFLVGQEQLLDLIGGPGMEHLHQRLVAATSLEPLSLDETVDYIEHRLTKVGWDGVPAIDEGALREIYRYSGGIPRRINLIANRLFLYGGMEEKKRFDAEDSRNVIQGLVEEFLLAPEPLIAEADVTAASASKGEGRSLSLPRKSQPSTRTPPPPETPKAPKTEAAPSPAQKGEDTPASGSAAVSAEPVKKNAAASSPENKPTPRPNDGAATEAKTKPVTPKPPPPAPAGKKSATNMERPVPPKPSPDASHKPDKKGGGKGIAMVVFLLAGAGAAYLLREQTGDQGQVYKPADPATKSAPQIPPAPELKAEKDAAPLADDPPVESKQIGIIVKSVIESGPGNQPATKTADRGEIIREQSSESVDAAVEPKTEPMETPSAKAENAKLVIPAEPQVSTPIVEAAAEAPKPVQTEAAPVLTKQIDKPKEADRITPPATAKKAREEVESPVPAKTVEHLAKAEAAVAQPDTAVTEPEITSVEAQRLRLRGDAEQRLSARQGHIQPTAEPGATKPETQPDAVPAKEVMQSAALSKPAPVEKRPRFMSNEIAATLLDGRWSSRGKPASLLPSDTTFCHKQGGNISCQSVPQNVNTQYGSALYKVETTLSGFSAQGHFEVSYRTLVKLVDSEATKSGWQVTDYSMSCTLVEADRVSCLDGKGVSREYRQTGLGKKR